MSTGFKNGLRRNSKGFWEYKIRVGRRTKSGTLRTNRKDTAVLLLAGIRDDMLREQAGLEVRLTVTQGISYWLETRGAGPRHLERAEYAFDKVRSLLGDRLVRSLTLADIVEFKKTLMASAVRTGKPMSPGSINLVLRYLSIAINWCFKNHKIAENPLREMPYEPMKEDSRPYLVIDEIVPFLKQVDALGTLHQRVAIRCQLLMGLRESESLHLRWDGFSGDQEFYTPAQTKSGRAQAIPVAKEVLRLLGELPKKSEWVLPGRAGSLHQKGYTKGVVVKAGVAIGKSNLTPHRLRASCATIVAGNGAGAHQVKDLLRHASISTSQFYVREFPQSIKNIANKTFDAVAVEFGPEAPKSWAGPQHTFMARSCNTTNTASFMVSA